MKINELKPRQGKVDIEVEVKSVEEPKTFNKFGKEGQVANAMVSDDTGEIKLTLWNDDVNRVKPGMKVKITNGYINEFQGEMQLTAGKFGKMEILGEDSAESEVEPATKKKKEK